MANRLERWTASLFIFGALVAGGLQLIENKNGISVREQVTPAAARLSGEARPTHPPPSNLTARAPEARKKSASPPPDPAPFAAFDVWFEAYEHAEPEARALEVEGEKIAIEREAALANLIVTDPERALQLAVPYERRKVLPESILRHLEEPVSGMARYDVVAFEPGTRPPGSSAVERYVTLNNQTYSASVYGRRVAVPSQPAIPLHGIAIGGALAVAEHPVRVLGALEAADRSASVPESAAFCPISKARGTVAYAAEIAGEVRYFCHEGHMAALNNQLEEAEGGSRARGYISVLNPSQTEGNKSLLFMRVNFPDNPTETISAVDAGNLITGVNVFMAQNSYGKLSITPTITPLLTLPQPKSWYGSSGSEILNFARVLSDARTVARAAGFDTSRYDLDCVHLDGNVVSSRGYVGQKGATLQDADVGRACHEFGHNLGLWHANGWEASDGSVTGPGSNVEYGNRFDTMGSGGEALGAYNACHRYRLGWLPASAVETITNDGVYTLYPFDVSGLENGRTYALRLPRDADRDYWIETREAGGGELLLNWSPWAQSDGGTQLLDMTPPSEGGYYDAGLKLGHSFYDPELGIKISPLRLSVRSAGAVEVLVKHVQYLALSAASASVSNGYALTQDAGSGPEALTLGGNGTALFTVNVPASGDYTVWTRIRGPGGPIVLNVDEQTATAKYSLESAGTAEWSWSRVVAGSSPASFSLSAGRHTVRISGGTSLTQVDSVLLTDDPTADLPPLFEPIPDQVATLSHRIVLSYSLFSPGIRGNGLDLTASSSNASVVPAANLQTGGTVLTEKTFIVFTPQALGQTLITLTATAPDGRSGKISFKVSVIGDVQLAVDNAAPGDTVRLGAGTYVDHLVIDKNISLEGSSAAKTILDGNTDGTALVIASNAVVSVKNLTIRNGTGGIVNSGVVTLADCEIAHNLNSPRGGGGVWNGAGAEISIARSTISSNRCAGPGVGLYNMGTLHLINSTVTGNRSVGANGGGIYNSGQAEVVHCTVAFNRAHGGGGGIANTANLANFELSNTIIAGNTADNEDSSDLKGAVLSQGFNLVQTTNGGDLQGSLTGNIVGRSALLAPLANNGGPTRTHALLSNSPALDSGDSAGVETDQRGLPRALDVLNIPNVSDGADIGAYEFLPDPSDRPVVTLTSDTPRLTLQHPEDGGVVITLDGNAEAAWLLQATSDFVSWETIWVLLKGQAAGFKDTGAQGGEQRFYRILPY
jgi:hypothetical protein